MRLSCGFIAFLLALLSSSSSYADPRGPVVAHLRVKGEKQRAEVTVEGSFAVPVYSLNSLNEGKQVVLEHLLGMRHLLSQRRNGVEIQTYLAVIACLVIGLQTGRKPDRRTVETLGWYLLGLATERDVIDHLNKPDMRGSKLRCPENPHQYRR